MIHDLFPAYFEWWHIPVIFLAGMIGEAYGCIVGGGGIMILAAQVYIGVPIKSAIATGTTGGLGTEVGVISETHKQITANKKLTLQMAIPYTIGGVVGVWLLLHVSPTIIKDFMIVAIIIVLIRALYAKGKKRAAHISKSQHILLFIFMFLASVYGSIAPGEGAFSKFALMSVLGLTFLQSQGMKAAATVPSRIYAMIVTTIAGLVVWPYAITLWVSTYIGAKYATKVAKKIPDKYLRFALMLVSIAFITYLVFIY